MELYVSRDTHCVCWTQSSKGLEAPDIFEALR